MTRQLEVITLTHLAIMILPIAAALLTYRMIGASIRRASHALGRMLLQLTLIGYLLVFLFESESSSLIILALAVMLAAASWIALDATGTKTLRGYCNVFVAVSTASLVVLFLVTQGVLRITPWYAPHTLIPLAGMIFSNSMNAVSLTAERYGAEVHRGQTPPVAKISAFEASLIPVTNSLFAVGLVALPGMMTGQILAGIDPLVAARYQIMVMTMIFSSSVFASAIYLHLLKYDQAELLPSGDDIRA